MIDTWKQWQGKIVNGQFPLIRYLGGSEHTAVFLTEQRESGTVENAVIKLVPSALENQEVQLSRWQLARALSHPHLISISGMGRCEFDNVKLLYVLMEYVPENLAEVLTERALTPVEARAMLDAVLDVLAYLHSRGLVHGHIKPANIMADGDVLKLSSDGLRRAGDWADAPGGPNAYSPFENKRGIISAAHAASPAEDVWSLAMTIVETLTQTLPVAPDRMQGAVPLPRPIPEPFLEIVRHSLLLPPQARWKVADIAAHLRSVAAKLQPAVQPVSRR
jgi:serine/threonine protein kinase